MIETGSSLIGSGPDPEIDKGATAEYRQLALRLLHDLPAGSERTALLLGVTGDEPSAESALWAARALAAEIDSTVLIVDASPSFPAASRLAGCERAPGFAGLLASPQTDWQGLVLATNSKRVFLLPSGSGEPSSGAFPEDAVRAFLAEASARHGFVILSGGPVLHDPLAIRLAPLVGCVLLFATEHATSRKDLETAQEAIRLSNARRAGIVLATGGPARRGWRRRP
jgi:Mrp family chromosome partitioning ATPase